MERFLNKRYRAVSSENFEELLEHLGVNLIVRKLITNLPCDCTMTQNADSSYTITVITTFKNFKVTFTPGVEFQSIRLDGEKVKSIMKVEDNKLLETQVDANGLKSYNVTEYTDNIMHVTVNLEGWDRVCTRTYELVK